MGIKGHIEGVTHRAIWGVASDDQTSIPLTVSLFINGEKVASKIANKWRKELPKKSAGTQKFDGFLFDLRDQKLFLPNRATIQVKVEPSYSELIHSPYFYQRKKRFPSSKDKKILVVGLPKSGTTILTYRIASGMKRAHVCFEPGEEETLYNSLIHKKITKRHKKVITKSLFIPKAQHRIKLLSSLYGKKIWIYRDLRDRIISSFFYSWYRRILNPKARFMNVYETVLRKEAAPSSIPFYTFLDKTDIQKLSVLISETLKAVQNLDSSWCLFAYEDMIKGNTSKLDSYLGFALNHSTAIPAEYKRVARSKNYGNWRNWFTQEDVEFFSPLMEDYLEFFGYDANDWKLNPVLNLPASEGSVYMKNLARSRLMELGKAVPPYLW